MTPTLLSTPAPYAAQCRAYADRIQRETGRRPDGWEAMDAIDKQIALGFDPAAETWPVRKDLKPLDDHIRSLGWDDRYREDLLREITRLGSVWAVEWIDSDLTIEEIKAIEALIPGRNAYQWGTDPKLDAEIELGPEAEAFSPPRTREEMDAEFVKFMNESDAEEMAMAQANCPEEMP